MAGVQLWMGPACIPVALPGDAKTRLIYDVSAKHQDSAHLSSFRKQSFSETLQSSKSLRKVLDTPAPLSVIVNEDYRIELYDGPFDGKGQVYPELNPKLNPTRAL
jgi:hypothetical protein